MQERYTKQAENVLVLAKQAASSCGHSYIGTEHLLVGLVEEKEGTAGRVLEEFGIQADKTLALIDELHMRKRRPCILRRQAPSIYCWQC